VVLLDETPDRHLWPKLADAVERCPTGAIRVE
jgi:ferredoxin